MDRKQSIDQGHSISWYDHDINFNSKSIPYDISYCSVIYMITCLDLNLHNIYSKKYKIHYPSHKSIKINATHVYKKSNMKLF